jgi:hypothetical protein
MSMAGARREIVTFQQHGPDENGDALGDWTDSFSRWGRVQVRKGGEEVLQQRQQGVTLVIITVPSRRRDAGRDLGLARGLERDAVQPVRPGAGRRSFDDRLRGQGGRFG